MRGRVWICVEIDGRMGDDFVVLIYVPIFTVSWLVVSCARG